MKRGTPRHPKTEALARALGLEPWGAVGILESLWHFAQQYAQRGDVGRFDDEAIEAAVGWSGEHGRMIQALFETRWLDRCPCHRLRIHDWPEHADAGVHNCALVKSQGFIECYQSLPNDSAIIRQSSGVQPAMAMATAKATAGTLAKAQTPSDAPTIAAYVSVYNAVFGRKVHILPTLEAKAHKRLARGDCKPWQLVALPLIVAAQGLDDRMRKALTPEILLRDGAHPRMTAAGYTCGGTDWLERAYLRADQTALSLPLSDIAREADAKWPGLLGHLMDAGVKIAGRQDDVQ